MKNVGKTFIGILILVFIASMSIYGFHSKINRLSFDNMSERLQEMANNNTRAVNLIFDYDLQYLNNLSRAVANTSSLYSQEARDLLATSVLNTEYEYLEIYDALGEGYNNKNERISITEDVKTELMQQHFAFRKLENNKIGICVPIKKNDINIGIIQKVYEFEILRERLGLTQFEEQGYYTLVNTNGDVLWEIPSSEEEGHLKNMFDVLETATFEKGDLQTLRKNIKELTPSSVIFKLNGDEQWAYYIPSGIADWTVMSIVPTSYLSQQKILIDQTVFTFLLIISTTFIIMLMMIIYSYQKSRKQIKDDRDYLDQVINTVSTPIFIIGNDRQLITVNQAACNIFKMKHDEILQQPCSIIHSNICGTSQCAIEKILHDGNNQTYMELRNRQYLVTTTYMNNLHQGNQSQFIEVLQDITELMDMQKILEERSLELETISENLVGGILITTLDEGFPIIRCNQGYLNLIGYEETEIIQEHALRWVVPDEAIMTEAAIFEQLQTHGEVRLEHRIMHRNGSSIWVSLYGKQAILHGQKVGIWLLINIDDRKRTEEELVMNEERYRIAAQNNEDIIIDYDILHERILHSEKAIGLYGVNEIEELASESIINLNIIDNDSIADFKKMFEEIHQGVPKVAYDILTHSIHGDAIWMHMVFTTIFRADKVPIRAIGVLHDFTAEKMVQSQYQREAQYRKMTMEDTALYYEVDLTHQIFVTGYEDLVNHYATAPTNRFDDIIQLMIDHLIYDDDRELVQRHINWKFLMNAYKQGKTKIEFEYRRLLNQTEFGWVDCTIYLLADEITNDVKALGYIRDIDDMKKLELSLKYQAERDLLTGIYNKMTTQRLIEKELEDHPELLHVLMIIDLDDFKQINDTLGHAFGDSVLLEVSTRLRMLIDRGSSIIGRIGGDEFIVYLHNVESVAHAVELAKNICSLLEDTYISVNEHCHISGSIGIACAPEDGTTFEHLYRNADIALYSSKSNGKGTYSFYYPSLSQIRLNKIAQQANLNYKKTFSNNIIANVFRMMYYAKTSDPVVNQILEFVSQHYHYQRAYIFLRHKEGIWKEHDEWCASDTASYFELFQHDQNEILENYDQNFDENGIFIINDVNQHNMIKMKLESLQANAIVQFAIYDNDELKGFVGFDDCQRYRVPSKAEVETLQTVSMMLGTFMLQKFED